MKVPRGLFRSAETLRLAVALLGRRKTLSLSDQEDRDREDTQLNDTEDHCSGELSSLPEGERARGRSQSIPGDTSLCVRNTCLEVCKVTGGEARTEQPQPFRSPRHAECFSTGLHTKVKGRVIVPPQSKDRKIHLISLLKEKQKLPLFYMNTTC
ncbi:peroxisome-assembly ATPase [Sarotherodon galilaeus]